VSSRARFDEAANRLGLDEACSRCSRHAEIELTVSIAVMLDIAHRGVHRISVQHSIARRQARAGIRFAHDVTLDECARWRRGSLEVRPWLNIRSAGGKAGSSRAEGCSSGDMERIQAAYTSQILDFIAERCSAPVMKHDAQTWLVMDTYSMPSATR